MFLLAFFLQDIEEYCAGCELCTKNKVVPMPRSPMKLIEGKPQPFYMMAVGIFGPLKTTSEGNSFLSVIDKYTKYAEAEPLPNQEAKTVVKALKQIFSRHVCSLVTIDKRRTSCYHPQSDGHCQRFNGILKIYCV